MDLSGKHHIWCGSLQPEAEKWGIYEISATSLALLISASLFSSSLRSALAKIDRALENATCEATLAPNLAMPVNLPTRLLLLAKFRPPYQWTCKSSGLNSENHLRVRPNLNGSRSRKYRGREKSRIYPISQPRAEAIHTIYGVSQTSPFIAD